MQQGEEQAKAVWKAVSTIEYTRNQKKAKAASKGAGAILDEATDAVAGKWSSSGGNPSGPSYLNRLSEIQIQNEGYIHQQLVREEAKPKRAAGLKLTVTKGPRVASGRALRVAVSRKVRFNDGDAASSSSKAAAAPQVHPGRIGSGASQLGGEYSAAAKQAVADNSSEGTGADSQAARSSSASISTYSNRPKATIKSPQAAGTAAHSSTNTKSKLIAAAEAPPPNRDLPQQHQLQQQDIDRGSAKDAKEMLPGTEQPYVATGGSHALSAVGNVIMEKFLQQQHEATEEQLEPLLPGQQQTGSSVSQSSGAVQHSRRSSTELADKHLQRLRNSTVPPSSSSAATQQPDIADALGYRPHAIPQELFERWSQVGTGAAARQATAASATADSPGPSAAAGASSSSSSGGRQQPRRTSERRLSVTNGSPSAVEQTAGRKSQLQHPSSHKLKAADSQGTLSSAATATGTSGRSSPAGVPGSRSCQSAASSLPSSGATSPYQEPSSPNVPQGVHRRSSTTLSSTATASVLTQSATASGSNSRQLPHSAERHAHSSSGTLTADSSSLDNHTGRSRALRPISATAAPGSADGSSSSPLGQRRSSNRSLPVETHGAGTAGPHGKAAAGGAYPGPPKDKGQQQQQAGSAASATAGSSRLHLPEISSRPGQSKR